MDWQPIETAPLYGKRILLFCPDVYYSVVIGRRGDECRYAPWSYWENEHDYGIADQLQQQPTYWMPLPDAPTA